MKASFQVITDEEWKPIERAGHDFALTRNGHGTGFWDRGLGTLGDLLTERAKAFGEQNAFVDDDGKFQVG